MTDRKIVAIVGATGAQGGGLARSILADPYSSFAVRALTRDPDSEKARELARRGAEIVAADLDDPASVRRAFDGAWAAFCLTSFWEHFSPEKEQAQARTMAEAAQAARLQHVVWSTLEDARRWIPLSDARMPTLMGRYKVPHTDAKGEMDALFTALGVPTTFLLTSFYWENLIHFGMGPKRAADGRLVLSLPMGEKPLPGIAAEDIGKCVYGILGRGRELVGRTVGIAGEHLTGEQMAAALGRALGEAVRYEAISPEAYRRSGIACADELGNMFQFKRDFNAMFCAARDLALSRALNPALQTFDEWLAANAHRIPIEPKGTERPSGAARRSAQSAPAASRA